MGRRMPSPPFEPVSAEPSAPVAEPVRGRPDPMLDPLPLPGFDVPLLELETGAVAAASDAAALPLAPSWDRACTPARPWPKRDMPLPEPEVPEELGGDALPHEVGTVS